MKSVVSRFCFQTGCLFFLALLSNSASAQIVVSGDISEDYDGTSDPWETSSLSIGRSDDGSMSISGGSVVNNSGWGRVGRIEYNADVLVTGAGSQWNNTSSLLLESSNSSVRIEDGGLLTNWGGELRGGMISIDGANSMFVDVGRSFEIVDGAFRVTNGAAASFGEFDASSGLVGAEFSVDVSGSGSQINVADDLLFSASIDAMGAIRIADDASINVGGSIRTFRGDLSFALDSGTLNTGGMALGFSRLSGNGVINAASVVADLDLVFDSMASLQQSHTIDTGGGNSVLLNIDANNMTDATVLGAGGTGNGSLTISNGMALSSGDGILGIEAGSVGTATVTGAGSTWTMTSLNGGLFVDGGNGVGTLNVESGGTVNIDGQARWNSLSTVAVSGDDSVLNAESASIYGALNVVSGGVVNVDGLVVVQDGASVNLDNGSLNVETIGYSNDLLSGNGVINTNTIMGDFDIVLASESDFIGEFLVNSEPDQNVLVRYDFSTGRGPIGVGYRDTGSLEIRNGMSLATSGSAGSSGRSTIGFLENSEGTVTVTGENSSWNEALTLVVGDNGTGTLNILDGGKVAVGSMSAGLGFTGSGAVLVSGEGSELTARSLGVFNSLSTLTVDDGASVNVELGAGFTSFFTGPGGSLRIANGGSVNLGTGLSGAQLIEIESGGLLDAPTGVSAAGMTVSGVGSQARVGDIRLSDSLIVSGGASVVSGSMNVGENTIFSIDEDSVLNVRQIYYQASSFMGGNFLLENGRLEGVEDVDLVSYRQTGGTLAPEGVADIFVNTLVLGGGQLELDLFSNDALGNDGIRARIFSFSGLDLVGVDGIEDTDLEILLHFDAEIGDTFQIISALNSFSGFDINGKFSDGDETSALFNNKQFNFDIAYLGGSDGVELTVTSIIVVPEPCGVSLLGLLFGCVLTRRSRKPGTFVA